MDKRPTENKAIPSVREPYAQPALKELGHVSALTQAGSTGDPEGNMDMGMGAEMKVMQ